MRATLEIVQLDCVHSHDACLGSAVIDKVVDPITFFFGLCQKFTRAHKDCRETCWLALRVKYGYLTKITCFEPSCLFLPPEQEKKGTRCNVIGRGDFCSYLEMVNRADKVQDVDVLWLLVLSALLRVH